MNKIEKIQDLINWNNKLSKSDGGRFLFRGMSNNNYLLIPKISRSNKNPLQSVQEDIAQERRKRLREYLNIRLPAYGYDFHNIAEDQKVWKELFIAQHYGAPTPLLDFTRNPMVALFFACISSSNIDGVVYSVGIKQQEGVVKPSDFKVNNKDYNIAAYNLMTSGKPKVTPYELKTFKFIVPPQFEARIKVQNSVFCCFPNENLTESLDIQIKKSKQKKVIKRGDMNYLHKWIIPEGKKKRILEELNNIGINYATLFPDLEGFGKFVDWKILNI
jgi:hypothetical protein